MRSSRRKLAAAAVLAAGAAVLFPIAAHADILETSGEHHLALDATGTSTHFVKVVNRSDGTENTYPVRPGRLNVTEVVMNNAGTYAVTCLDDDKKQIGQTSTIGPLQDDGGFYTQANCSAPEG
jgi:hypothetical protein